MKRQPPRLLTVRIGHTLRCIVLLTMAFFLSFDAEASHYRFGNISWSIPNPASPRNVSFKVQMAFRRTFYPGPPNLGNTVSSGVNLDFGDGSGSVPINLLVTSINTTDDWFFGEATITHTYGGTGTTFTASYLSNARISTLQNNANANFASFTVVTLTSPINNSPVTTSPPIVSVQTGQASATFQLAASDPENQTLTYRFATAAEMGGGAQTQPTGMNVSSSGLVTFNTSALSAGNLYNAAFVVTDAAGASTMLDILVRTVAPSTPPTYDYSVTPANAHTYDIHPGQTLSFSVKALDTDPGDVVSLNVVGAPGGSSFVPTLPTSGNPVTTAFSWTPTAADLGSRVMTFTAEDNSVNQTTTSVTIIVSLNPVFDVPPTPALAGRQCIAPGTLHQETIQVHSPDVNQNVTLSTSTTVSGVSYSPSLPVGGANSVQTTMSWTPTVSQYGDHNFVYTATDGFSHTTTHNFTLVVNSVPAFTSVPVTSAIVGQTYTYNIVVSDPDIAYGDILEILATAKPAWLTLTDNGDGTATLTGTPALTDVGLNHVQLDAEDIEHHCHAQVMQAFDINVIPCTISCSIASAPTSGTYTDGNVRHIYLGYGSGATKLTVTPAGGTGFTYSWSPSTNLSCTTCANPTFTPTAGGNYTFTATATQTSTGCTTTCTIVICVLDIRGSGSGQSGQVYICHAPPGNPNNKQTLLVGVSAVPAHLSNHSGDKIGACGQMCAAGAKMIAGYVVGPDVKIYPNPNNGTFTIELPYLEDNAIITVTDVAGKTIYNRVVRDGDDNKQTLQLTGAAAGMYFVEVTIGDQNYRNKLIIK